MTHDELLQRVQSKFINNEQGATECVTTEAMLRKSLISVVELHKPVLHSKYKYICEGCNLFYPCDTIEVIAKEMP